MHLRAVITGLVLLVIDPVISKTSVKGVVGQTVRLPCTYSTAKGVTATCWGRGSCPISQCSNIIIWTNGHRITYLKDNRYNLIGNILRGDVSMTIKNAKQDDSGQYCCRVRLSGWFNDIKRTITLLVQPMKPTTTTKSQPTTSRKTKHPTSSSTLSCTTDGSGTVTRNGIVTKNGTVTGNGIVTGNGTVTGNGIVTGNGTVTDGVWHDNQTDTLPAQNLPAVNQLNITISIVAIVLITLLLTMIVKKSLNQRKKELHTSMASLNDPQIGTLQDEASFQARAKDNVVEDNPYVMK